MQNIAAMKTVYVVRELVTAASEEKEIRTHYEYGLFPTYRAPDCFAIATGNQSWFPHREGLLSDPLCPSHSQG
jgi:hypothetical protein